MLLFITGITSAEYVSPNTGRNWTLDSLVANSGGAVTFSGGIYYFIEDSITISKSDTLKILTNATVKFPSLGYLYIKGTLLINPTDSVKFTAADTTQYYKGITLDSAYASSLKKLIFEYANCINIMDCSPLIDSCTIRNNLYYGTGSKSGAISLFRSNATIANSKIYRNVRAAIVGGANIANSPTIFRNIFYDNNTSNYNTSQINLGAGSTTPIIIRGNSILRASTNSGAIAFLPAGTIPLLIIENNIIKNNRYGIALLAGGINAYINDNVIDSCNTQGSPSLGGSGLNFAGTWATSSVICTRNVIRWNLWGVTIQNSAKPNLGNLSSPDTTDVGLNIIYGNGNSGKIYDLYNNTLYTSTDTIKAENNYWGTTNLDTIEAHIFHHADSSVLGVVDYLPIRTLTSIGNPVIKVDTYEFLDLYPNPFNPEVTIKFRIKNDGFTRIRIYDLLGREVMQIANEYLKAGEYERNWISKGLASSVYIVRLETSLNTYAKRIAVVK
jgi:hypothetical protein